MSTDTRTVSHRGSGLGGVCLLFWLIVHFACPYGVTWGGISVHTAAYVALLVAVVPTMTVLVFVAVVVLIALVAS